MAGDPITDCTTQDKIIFMHYIHPMFSVQTGFVNFSSVSNTVKSSLTKGHNKLTCVMWDMTLSLKPTINI